MQVNKSVPPTGALSLQRMHHLVEGTRLFKQVLLVPEMLSEANSLGTVARDTSHDEESFSPQLPSHDH